MSNGASNLTWRDGGAQLSPDQRHRFRLWRHWGPKGGRYMAFVMLNPSTADGAEDDATVRRCVGFAKREGLDGLVIVNLFSFRATYPVDLYRAHVAHCALVSTGAAHVDPCGDPTNLHVVQLACRYSALVVCAWGAQGARYPQRVTKVVRALRDLGTPLYAFTGSTKGGQPPHPLRLAKTLPLVAWRGDGLDA